MQFYLLLIKCPVCSNKVISHRGPEFGEDYSCKSCHTISSSETVQTRRLSKDEITEYKSLNKKPTTYREDFDVYNDYLLPAFIRRKIFVEGYEEYEKELKEVKKRFIEGLG